MDGVASRWMLGDCFNPFNDTGNHPGGIEL
jgi:hypothetical protein